MRRLLTLAALLAAVAPAWPQATVTSAEKPLYINRAFGFTVRLPPGVTYTRTTPPNPDHGFEVQTPAAPATRIWVDASPIDSAATSDEEAREADGCRVLHREPIALGGRAAVRMQVACPAAGTEKAYEEDRAFLVALTPHRAPLCYQVAVRTEDGTIPPAAEALFRKLVAAFRFR